MIRLLVLLAVSLATSPLFASASHFSDIVRGMILLDVEQNGEAWYAYPETMRRHFLGRPADAFDLMRELSLGISDADLAKIPINGSGEAGDAALRSRLSGLILLQVEGNGEAWYVFPETRERHFLGRPADAFAIMSALGLGISSANLAHIPIDPSSLEPPFDESSTSRSFNLTTPDGSFPVRVVTLRRSDFEMVTDTAEEDDCDEDCSAIALDAYILKHAGFAGIHGTYFCPPDYAPCEGQVNTFLPPVYKTGTDKMINEKGLKHFERPMIAQTDRGELLYFHRAQDFGDSVQEFESRTGDRVHAAIGNWPSLVENGSVVVHDEPLEPGFLTKAARGGIGWNDGVVSLVIAQEASVPDLASIFHTLGADFAMNLDGGGSAALHYDGAYKAGPGRLLPNAIIFRKRN